mgnify:CR=1 FL=1
MNGKIYLTFDIDWAPDETIKEISHQLINANIKSTWFVTHKTPVLEILRERDDLFSLGIHPNFLKGSTQGSSEEEILKNLMKIVPEAKVIRTHGIFQYGGLFGKIINLTSIKIDSSIFLPEMENIDMLEHHTPQGVLKRIPIFWADDHELLKQSKGFNLSKYISQNGLKVFLFHPIHIYLNSSNIKDYNSYKKNGILSRNNHIVGVGTFFYRLIDYIKLNSIKTNFLTD